MISSLEIASLMVALLSSTSTVSAANPYTGPPIQAHTPGFLCTPQDPNYISNADLGVPKCVRNIGSAEKAAVLALYVPGADSSTYSNYEFDHMIPLGVGGSNDPRNLWPQLLGTEQKLKDRVEDQAYLSLKNGTKTQPQAIQMIWDNVNTAYSLGKSYNCYDNSCLIASQTGKGKGGGNGGNGGNPPPVIVTSTTTKRKTTTTKKGKKTTTTTTTVDSTTADTSSSTTTDVSTTTPAPASSCAHDICKTGAALDASCDDCAAQIIAKDSYCGETGWSYICVNEVSSVCGLTC